MTRGNQTYYRLRKDWVSESIIKTLTVAIKVEPISLIKDKDCPF